MNLSSQLHSDEKTYMASISWAYAEDQLIALRRQNAAAEAATPVATGVDINTLRLGANTRRSSASYAPMERPQSLSSAPIEPMRLRQKHPPVTQLSRKVLLGLGVVATAGVATLIFALEPHRSTTGSELYNTSNRTTPDGVPGSRAAFRSVPQLGPPLPGNLGRPIVNAALPPPACRLGPTPSSSASRKSRPSGRAACSRQRIFVTRRR